MLTLLPAAPQAAAAEITISTAAELEAFRDSVNSGKDYSGVTVKLTADIELGGAWDEQWTPIGAYSYSSGTDNTPFAGIFDGGGHTITGVYILTDQLPMKFCGLFGYNSGTVQNLNVTAYISNIGVTGGIVGRNTGTVTNCCFTGFVKASSEAGGIVGQNYEGTVTDCCFAGTVKSSDDAGGIVGQNYEGIVANCCSTGSVKGEEFVGGVVGGNREGTVINCYNTGSVKGSDYDYSGVVDGCTVYLNAVGGVVGCTYDNDIVAYCYNTGSVSGKVYVGGVVGDRDAYMSMYGWYGEDDIGGITNCYYLTGTAEKNGDTSDKDAGNSGAIDEAAFAVQSTFADWDFVDTWIMDDIFHRPVLRTVAEYTDDTEYDPYRINTLSELEFFRDSVNHGITYNGITVTLMADFDLGGSADNPWIPVGGGTIHSFAGTFEGGGHTITGLYIETSDFSQGLFASNTGTIQNLGVEGSVSGGSYVGGVVGWNDGIVKNCYYVGSVSGDAGVGGVAGRNNYREIINCYSIGTVSGSTNVGGVAGLNTNGTIKNCYSIGVVAGSVSVGGVAGCHDAATTAVNRTSEVTGSYYLADSVTTEGVMENVDAGNSAAIGRAAYGVKSTFADWDFEGTWTMDEWLGRPVLRAVPEVAGGMAYGRFEDVLYGAWYHDPVRYVFEHGLMTGVSGTEFAPDADVTRGMFVTCLYRMENEPKTAMNHHFTDVAENAYYAEAVAWVSGNNIAAGVSDEKFAPEENITREQMAAILFRYAAWKGQDARADDNCSYADADEISDYALKAVVWVTDNLLMQGSDDNRFMPMENATRAEVAAVFRRIAGNLKEQ